MYSESFKLKKERITNSFRLKKPLEELLQSDIYKERYHIEMVLSFNIFIK